VKQILLDKNRGAARTKQDMPEGWQTTHSHKNVTVITHARKTSGTT